MPILRGPPSPKLPKIKPVVGPQNVGLPGYRPGDAGNPFGVLAPPPLAAPAPAAAAPPPVDFSTLVGNDPEYKRQQAQMAAQNQLNLDALLHGFKGQAQGSQDSFNAHGGLFSGAAVNAQRNLAQGYEGQVRQQALGYQGQQGDALRDAWQRLLQQLAGGA